MNADSRPFTSDPHIVDGAPRESDRTVDQTFADVQAALDDVLAGISDAREALLSTQGVGAAGDVERGQDVCAEVTPDLYLAHAASDLRTALSLLRNWLRGGY